MKRPVRLLVGIALFAAGCVPALSQSQTAGEFWPEAYVFYQLPENWRLLAIGGLKNSEETGYRQVNAGLALGHQWLRIKRPHLENIDPDKEHAFVVGGGYENLQTLSGKSKFENRLVLEGMPGYRFLPRLFVRDRNRVEFRWINGVYSTRYRNELSAEYDFKINNFRFTPYGAAEAYYNGPTSSWNEEQYTAGVQWPVKRLLQIDTYYLRQNCTTCSPPHLNVAGLTLNFYFRHK